MMNSSHVKRGRAIGVLAAAAILLVLGSLAARLDPARAGGAALEIYVAPDGSDSGAGTIEDPFATLGRAQEAVRLATPGMAADVVVNLRGGTYRTRTALQLDAAAGDSGENGHQVVYQAYGYGTPEQEAPVISGGKPVTGWKLVDRRHHIWKAAVGTLSPRQLYSDGERVEPGSIGGIPGDVRRTKTGYVTTSTQPQAWANPSDIEFVYTPVHYSQAVCGVAAIEPVASGTRLVMDQPCFKWLSRVYTYNEADPENPNRLVAPSPAINSPSFLARPDTWAIDRSTPGKHHIYYRSAPGEDPNANLVIAPRTETLIEGNGTKTAPLHDVAFQGISFEYSTWVVPNRPEGFVQIFGDFYFAGGSPSGSLTEATAKVPLMPGSLEFEHTRGLLFEGNRFAHLGADALDLRGTVGNVVRGNTFAGLAAGALKLDGLNDGSDAQNLVENNRVDGIGLDYQASIAVYLEDIVDSTVRHNEIEHVPYSGISQTISEAEGHGVQILNNRISDVTSVAMDGGGIYTSGAQGTSFEAGAVIAGNDVSRALNPVMEQSDPDGEIGAPNAIYTDVGADYITLHDNLITTSHQSWGGVAPKRMRFFGNYWDDRQLLFYGPTRGLEMSDNTLLGSSDPRRECLEIPDCAAIVAAAGLEPAWQARVPSITPPR